MHTSSHEQSEGVLSAGEAIAPPLGSLPQLESTGFWDANPRPRHL